MLLEEVIGAFFQFGTNDIGLDRLTVRWKLVNDGDVQVSVDHQSKRSGNWGSGHNQGVRMVRFFGKFGSLSNAKTMLFIGDNQCQIWQIHILGDEGMGADYKIDHPKCDSFLDISLFLCSHGAAKQSNAHPKRREKTGKSLKMLLCQNFSRSHQSGQIAILEGDKGGSGCYHRFSRTNIPLNQTIHRGAFLQVRADIGNCSLLSTGELEGQLCKEGGKVNVFAQIGGLRKGVIPDGVQRKGKHQKLFKNQTPTGNLNAFPIGGKVNVFERKVQVTQLIFLTDGCRKRIGEIFVQQMERL